MGQKLYLGLQPTVGRVMIDTGPESQWAESGE